MRGFARCDTGLVSILCIGAAHVDYRGVLRGPTVLGTSNRGDVHRDFGGVARNVAENLARLGMSVAMLSRVGGDATGAAVRKHLDEMGIDTSLISQSPLQPSASYTAILESNGELVIGLNDADIYEELTWDLLEPELPRMRANSPWFVDTNVPGSTIERLAALKPLYVDGVSVERVRRLRPILNEVAALFTNLAQASSLADRELEDPRQAAEALYALGVQFGVVTNGAAGALAWEGRTTRSYEALQASPRDVTGAGDALVAGTLYALAQGSGLLDAVPFGMAAAAITVESSQTTSPALNAQSLQKRAHACQ